jgi:hypothetical protein
MISVDRFPMRIKTMQKFGMRHSAGVDACFNVCISFSMLGKCYLFVAKAVPLTAVCNHEFDTPLASCALNLLHVVNIEIIIEPGASACLLVDDSLVLCRWPGQQGGAQPAAAADQHC